MFLKFTRRHFSAKINPKINYYEALGLKNEKASENEFFAFEFLGVNNRITLFIHDLTKCLSFLRFDTFF